MPLDDTIEVGGRSSDINPASVTTPESRTETRTETINVPSDFPTVAEAIAEVEAIRAPTGLLFEINIESGHTISETVRVDGGDLSHVSIVSEDPTVPVDGTLTTDGFDGVFQFFNCHAPTLKASMDFNNNDFGGAGSCVNYRNSRGVIESSVTIRNSSARGLTINKASTVAARGITLEDHGRGLAIYSSTANLLNATIRNADGRLIRAHRGAVLVIENATLEDHGTQGIFAENSRIHAKGLSMSSPSKTPFGAYVSLLYGTIFNGQDATITTDTRAAVLAEHSVVANFSNATMDGSVANGENGILIQDGSRFSAPGAVIGTANWSEYPTAEAGSSINLQGADLSNIGISTALVLSSGSTANLDGCPTPTSSGDDPHESDLGGVGSFNTVSGNGIAFAENFET